MSINEEIDLSNINVESHIGSGINATNTGVGGPRGIGITKIEQITAPTESSGVNVIRVTLGNGETYDYNVRNGQKGEKGDTGDIGETGNGISSVVLNSDYTLTINYTDGTSTTTGSVRGEQGSQGIKGDKGEKGDKGDQGIKGDKGDTGETGAQGIQGIQGVQGVPGKDFSISKTYTSIIAMIADKANVNEGDFVIIASDVEDPDNAKLYVRTDSDSDEDAFSFITDMSGAQGMKGEKGEQGVQGVQGIPGEKGEKGDPGPTYTAGDAINITNDEISADIYPADFFTAGETTNDSGSNFTLPKTIRMPILDAQLKGNTYQQTYSGKNILPSNGLTAQTISGVTFTPFYNNNELLYIEANGTSTATGISGSLYDVTANMSFANGLAYTISGCEGGSGSTYRIWVNSSTAFPAGNRLYSQDGERTMTSLATESGIRVFIQVWDTGGQTIRFYPQIVQGTSAGEYEPYTGGIPAPNPDYPQTVDTVTGRQLVTISDGDSQSQSYEVNLGKNLFDKDNANIANVWAGYDIVIDGATLRTLYIPCDPNTTYTVQKENTGTNNRFMVFTTNVVPAANVPVLNAVGTSGALDNSSSCTITTAPNSKYLCVFFANTTVTTPSVDEILATIQIEKGSTATSYAAYFNPIELCKIGNYQDYIYKNGDDWYVHKETGSTNVSTFTGIGGAASGTKRFCFNLPSGAIYPLNTNIGAGYGNIVPLGRQGSTYDRIQSWVLTTTEGLFWASDTANMTLAEANTWLASHPFIIYYPLATPTDTQITNADLVAQLEALASGNTYNDATVITVTSNGDLAAIADITGYRKSLEGIIAAINSIN